ncbi:MAG TPA: hypothetical protein VH478_04280 [Trebonia sp.]|nr:hypothetical protein [Trebonia sp.]
MTSQLDHVRPVATPGRVGQGTAVEQSRAIAEVQAQVIVAQQMPRDIGRADLDMRRSCNMKGLAEKAFYRYSRAGSQISGPSVQLARELARCWGNIQYGITELRRDDDHGQSEMLAFAWDLETNTRSATTFIVQHVRDAGGRQKQLTEQRDIYENNANNGARRLREMIFAILPGWYTEDAVAACYATLAGDKSDGDTVEQRADAAVARYGKQGITLGQLENKLGAPRSRWSPSDLAQLAVIWRSIGRGETTAEAEFGPSPARVTAKDVLEPGPQGEQPKPGRQRGKKADDAPPPPPDPPADPEAAPAAKPGLPLASDGQVGMIVSTFGTLGYGDSGEDRASRLSATSRLAGRAEVIGSTRELTADEAAGVIRQLSGARHPDDLEALLSGGEAAGGE